MERRILTAVSLVLYAWRLPMATTTTSKTASRQTAPETIHISSDIKQISAHQDQIGIILANGEIMAWQFGGGTMLIDTSKVHAESHPHKPRAFGLLFHPVNHGHFFIFSEWEIANRQRQIA